MKLFDPHIHMTSRTTDDYAAMRRAGIIAVTEPAFWLGQPRTHAGSFEDYFLSLVGWERFRASQFGIRHFCTLGLNPKEANNPDIVDPVLELVDLYLEKDGVVAVGEIGYDDMTPAEDDILSRQVEMAIRHRLPIMVHTPHRDKKAGTRRTIDLLREAGVPPHMVLIDHNNEETLPITLDSGCWAGHTIYPGSKMDEPRMVGLVQTYGAERIMVNSSADWGISDPLKVPKTVAAMEEAGISAAAIETIVWRNPIAFYAQSGRLDPAELEETLPVDQRLLFEGNTVLRGQKPTVELPATAADHVAEPA
ncbi:hydrolase TatD [Azospirillum thiophilum]|uniref:Hydrolase TatD n=1 Tax=Azospirillum thiophilum TaxID=528244 RepID=A0AAC8W4S8_9PROT|nr:TatD family hydrolase [Azospirillum thiophilum]ALG75093.1 hydrolase TatD [Azospirillum thiophilum]KJR62488.1 hydrolase TatD [Azospirillum thiophilum]